jgi:hypothetical protein
MDGCRFCKKARVGECMQANLEEIQKLVLINPECNVPEFSKSPWNNAILVTPRNSVRTAWNRAMLRKHCGNTGNILYVVDAEDTVGEGRCLLNMEQKMIVAGLPLEDRKSTSTSIKQLRHRLESAIGMKVMITLNLATEADLANGSRGIIEDIVLDPRERVTRDDIGTDGIVWLRYAPTMILFRPFHYEFAPFPGMEEGLIPIFLSEVTFNIHYHNNPKTQIHRHQYPVCVAYAFTDHKSQGQTIEYVIVDIGPTKKFPIDPFTTYVALSCSCGCETIRLLQDFDHRIFTTHPSEDLCLEDQHLQVLADQTKIRFKMGEFNF